MGSEVVEHQSSHGGRTMAIAKAKPLPNMQAALYIIAGVARRENLSPMQTIDLFEDGMLVHWWSHQETYWRSPEGLAAVAPENVADIAIKYPMNQVGQRKTIAPTDMQSALDAIVGIALRDGHSPDAVVEILNNGMLVNTWRYFEPWKNEPEFTARARAEMPALDGAATQQGG